MPIGSQYEDELLHGLQWNYVLGLPEEMQHAVGTILARASTGEFHAVGCGFVFQSSGRDARIASAAHVFEEVQRLQRRGESRSHTSTLPEFAPPPPPIDLALSGMTAIFGNSTEPRFAEFEGLAFDLNADIGIAQIKPQSSDPVFALPNFAVDDRVPQIGDLVCIAGNVDIKASTAENAVMTLNQQFQVRIGRVTNVFPEGQRLCKGPCFETSIPIPHGMSGSPVMLFDPPGIPGVIGVACSDPDEDTVEKDDRTRAGCSIVARLPVQRISGTLNGQQTVSLSFIVSSAAGTIRPS